MTLEDAVIFIDSTPGVSGYRRIRKLRQAELSALDEQKREAQTPRSRRC